MLSNLPAQKLNKFLCANIPAQESYLKNLIKISLIRFLLKVQSVHTKTKGKKSSFKKNHKTVTTPF